MHKRAWLSLPHPGSWSRVVCVCNKKQNGPCALSVSTAHQPAPCVCVFIHKLYRQDPYTKQHFARQCDNKVQRVPQ